MSKPRIPTQIKVIRGTFRQNEAPKNEPVPTTVKAALPAPAHLNKWARSMWKDVSRELVDLKMLSKIDTYSLEVLCEQYGIYRELKDAITHIDVEGKRVKITLARYLAGRNSQTMPEYAAMKSAFERYCALLKEFGLSPASRSRMDIPREAPQTVDPMEAILEAK